MSKTVDRDVFDFCITSYVQLSQAEIDVVKSENLERKAVSSYKYNRYKFHVDIDGNSNAWSGLSAKLISGGLVFKVESPAGFRQWYYDRLVPWQHFVPVRSDLSDLVELYDEFSRDTKAARKIAQAGRSLALSLDVDSEIGLALERIGRFAD